ncbi:MAG: hypothetical protein NC037_05340 [Bacteroides sp.]|nr:hypothetical protein [Bacillota bacterium]MCM1394117.1 hypothetical protein [[Eubacterium] siraeum]MCM1455930.1 hypothetical protein [Bacteroides sp.]
MELRFLTPTEVWNKFDPTAVVLDSSTTSTETDGNSVCVKQYFSVSASAQTRLYMEIYYDLRWTDPRPALLLIESYRNRDNRAMAKKLMENGYIVGLIDYCGGIVDGEDKTELSSNLSFAAYPECQNDVDVIKKNARNSAWFVWSKISRYALTVLELLPIVDKTHVGVIGFGEGAHIAWQVAGIDNRVRSLVAVGDTGYHWAKGRARFLDTGALNTDEDLVFSSGVGAETYAKSIHCPTLLVVAKSAYTTDLDRAGDILELVQSDCKHLLITNGNDIQLTKAAFESMLNWLHRNFVNPPVALVNPSVSFENVDGKLYMRLDSVYNAKELLVFICYGEPRSNARHWERVEDLQKVDTQLYTAAIPVYDADELVVVYSTIIYDDDSVASTPTFGVVPSKLGVKSIAPLRDSYRILYDTSMGIGSFSGLTKDLILDEDSIVLEDGPFDIKGITAKRGGLSICRSAAEMKAVDRTNTFHFDAYSPVEREIRVNMYAAPDMKRYTATVHLDGGEFWQKVLLQITDFKSDEGRTLAQFNSSKIIAIPDTNEVLLNNFLWI